MPSLIERESVKPLDLSALRERLQNAKGRQYWRSLEEVAETPEFKTFLHREFPQGASELTDGVSRRNFLKLMGASIALAGVNACTRQPLENIVPYVRAPEVVIPGKPLFFASAILRDGFASPVLVESHMGRPTKIEGSPDHPISRGAADAITQASILSLYDPDRSQVISKVGSISTWELLLGELNVALQQQSARQGAGLRILTGMITSPTLISQIENVLQKYPRAQWHQYQPAGRDTVVQGANMAFGEVVSTHYDLSNADVILSLDSDFFVEQPESLRYTRDFAARRRAETEAKQMNRLYAIESSPTLAGTMADHRLSLQAGQIEAAARAIAAEIGVAGIRGSRPAFLSAHSRWITAVANDLKKNQGRCVVIAGEYQPAAVHALAHAINNALGNVGKTVRYTEPVESLPAGDSASLASLTQDMASGNVELLLILGTNPAYDAPADLEFVKHLEQVKLRVHLGTHEDETSQVCHWHVNQTHELEAWSDARAADGTVTIVQPLIAPLFSGRSAHEVLSIFEGNPGRSSYDIVRAYWQAQRSDGEFEKWWQTVLHDGFIPATAAPNKAVALNLDARALAYSSSDDAGVEIIFRPDPTVWDGTFSNNGWLQELPKPLTKLTWDNAALISVAMAEEMGLENEDVIEIKLDGRKIQAPVWVMPGHPANSITVHLGYGRERAGHVGSKTGFNAYNLRNSASPWFQSGAEVSKTGETYELAVTQMHHSMEGRHLVRTGTLKEYTEHPEFIHEMGHDPGPEMTMYPKFEHDGYAWGMTIDLNACTGCNACVTACQAENNIPVVGKTEVRRGREMHWIRIDRYYEGDLDQPATFHQPIPCMHCENAPCEVVCPVAATTHSPEGLNEMTYNRCVGTRYCANNCPYKVRRFNFFKYADFDSELPKLARNPDVTVRFRGVMEKCTYCVQRINAARIEAKREDRSIADGEIQTACEQTCPAGAIVFGDINDANSRVARLKASHLNYGILTEIGTRPRTTFLARLRNPNPELEEA